MLVCCVRCVLDGRDVGQDVLSLGKGCALSPQGKRDRCRREMGKVYPCEVWRADTVQSPLGHPSPILQPVEQRGCGVVLFPRLSGRPAPPSASLYARSVNVERSSRWTPFPGRGTLTEPLSLHTIPC